MTFFISAILKYAWLVFHDNNMVEYKLKLAFLCKVQKPVEKSATAISSPIFSIIQTLFW